MAGVPILKREHFLKMLRNTSPKYVVGGVVALGAFSLMLWAIKKGLSIEVAWKDFFKDGSIKLSVNNGRGM